jgi:hypothetical protein
VLPSSDLGDQGFPSKHVGKGARTAIDVFNKVVTVVGGVIDDTDHHRCRNFTGSLTYPNPEAWSETIISTHMSNA